MEGKRRDWKEKEGIGRKSYGLEVKGRDWKEKEGIGRKSYGLEVKGRDWKEKDEIGRKGIGRKRMGLEGKRSEGKERDWRGSGKKLMYVCQKSSKAKRKFYIFPLGITYPPLVKHIPPLL